MRESLERRGVCTVRVEPLGHDYKEMTLPPLPGGGHALEVLEVGVEVLVALGDRLARCADAARAGVRLLGEEADEEDACEAGDAVGGEHVEGLVDPGPRAPDDHQVARDRCERAEHHRPPGTDAASRRRDPDAADDDRGRCADGGHLAAAQRVDIARIAANPPTLIGVIAASEPPAIMTSASLRRMISKASPMACAEAEQAVQVAEFGPLALKRIDT